MFLHAGFEVFNKAIIIINSIQNRELRSGKCISTTGNSSLIVQSYNFVQVLDNTLIPTLFQRHKYDGIFYAFQGFSCRGTYLLHFFQMRERPFLCKIFK